MTFLERVTKSAKSLGEGAKTIGGKAGDIVESTKLKFEVSKLEKEVENNIYALGNLVFMQFKEAADHEAEINRLLNTTKVLEEEIVKLSKEIEKLNPKPPVCPKCNVEYPPNAKYCMNCGEKLAQETPSAE